MTSHLIFGGSGGEVLEGDDDLGGGRGNDHLYGGVGNDKLHGDDGFDKFSFESGDGYDIIYDFTAWVDMIVFDGVDFEFSDLDVADDEDGYAVISYGDGDSITLYDFASGGVTSNIFEFT